MTLLPVMSPVSGFEVIGAQVSTDGTSPDYDFTSFDIQAGDLLVAIVAGKDADQATVPTNFSLAHFANNGTSRSVKVFTKTASGSETTITSTGGEVKVATAAVRNGPFGASFGLAGDSDQTDNPPSIANSLGDIVFVVLGSAFDQGTVTAPTGYTLAGSEFSETAESFLSLAYKARSLASEDPGVFGGVSNSLQTVAVTFSLTRA